MSKSFLTDREKDLLYEAIELACEMVNSLQQDIEEDPDSASNTTIVHANNFCNKMDELNAALDGAKDRGGMQ